MFIRIVFVLGPEGTKAIMKRTEKSGLSMYQAAARIMGGGIEKCTVAFM
jgi:hypothetical protein